MDFPYSDFDALYERWYAPVYQLCFLLSCDRATAEKLTFTIFLYTAAQADMPTQPEEAAVALLQRTVRTCEDDYYRKARRKPTQEKLEKMHLPFPVDSTLLSLLRQPLEHKSAFYLRTVLQLPDQTVCRILHLKSAARLDKLSALEGPYAPDVYKKAAGVICLDEDGKERLSDRIILHFQERNVKLEKGFQTFRSAMNRVVPWIALGIVLLFIAAAWYTAQL